MKVFQRLAAPVVFLAMLSVPASGNSEGENMLKIVVLSIPKCEATPPTIALVEEGMKELGLQGTVENIIIDNAEDANRHRFIGSPTVQINGLDIDPAMRSVERFGVT